MIDVGVFRADERRRFQCGCGLHELTAEKIVGNEANAGVLMRGEYFLMFHYAVIGL